MAEGTDFKEVTSASTLQTRAVRLTWPTSGTEQRPGWSICEHHPQAPEHHPQVRPSYQRGLPAPELRSGCHGSRQRSWGGGTGSAAVGPPQSPPRKHTLGGLGSGSQEALSQGTRGAPWRSCSSAGPLPCLALKNLQNRGSVANLCHPALTRGWGVLAAYLG